MNYFNMFIAEVKYGIIMQKRYLFDSMASVINILLFLIFIQLGLYSFQSEIMAIELNTRLSQLIIGFFVFMIISGSISIISSNISEGATTGTLEQTMLTSLGPEIVFLCRAVVGSFFNFILTILLLPISMLICRHWFDIDVFGLFFYVIPLWLSSWGVGFILGAATLVYKRTQSFLNLTQFLILFLIILPSYPFNYLSLLPICPQAMTINKVFATGIQPSNAWILFIFTHGLMFLILGLCIFKLCEQYSRNKGILGQY